MIPSGENIPEAGPFFVKPRKTTIKTKLHSWHLTGCKCHEWYFSALQMSVERNIKTITVAGILDAPARDTREPRRRPTGPGITFAVRG